MGPYVTINFSLFCWDTREGHLIYCLYYICLCSYLMMYIWGFLIHMHNNCVDVKSYIEHVSKDTQVGIVIDVFVYFLLDYLDTSLKSHVNETSETKKITCSNLIVPNEYTVQENESTTRTCMYVYFRRTW